MKKKFTTRDLILCALFTALSAIGAFIRIPVPLVPFTLQITFTTLAGLLLGSKKGAISVAVYVLMGLIGIPVFTADIVNLLLSSKTKQAWKQKE